MDHTHHHWPLFFGLPLFLLFVALSRNGKRDFLALLVTGGGDCKDGDGVAMKASLTSSKVQRRGLWVHARALNTVLAVIPVAVSLTRLAALSSNSRFPQ